MLNTTVPLATSPISRRKFCAGACHAASTATLATLVTACSGGESSSPTSPSGMPSRLDTVAGRFSGNTVHVTVGGSALTSTGGAALVESTAGVFLLSRTGPTAFTAVDAVCSHQSCTITGIDGAIYVCPCHGSRYDLNGRVRGGPAQASLRQFTTTFADGIVTIAL